MAKVSVNLAATCAILAGAVFAAGGMGACARPGPAPTVEADSLATAPDAAAESLLVDVRTLDPTILVDLRYATTNNFTGAVLPGYGAQKALLRREAAQALARVEARLRTGGLGLRIWDAYRPVRATRAMVVWAERTGRTDLLDQEYMARRSRHNLGVAVDLTLVDLVTGTELDMGTPFDTFSEAAHTAKAVLRSSTERSIEGDYPQDSDYREDNDFFYLTGAEAPESWLVLVARDSALAQAILYLPVRDTVTPYRSEQWVGPRLNPGPAAVALTGIQDVRAADLARKQLPALVFGPDSPARAGMVYVKPGRGQGDSPFLRDSILGLAQAGAGIRVGNLTLETAPLRLVKDADEIARLRRAIALTTSAEQAAMGAIRPAMYEYEIEALIEYIFRRGGAERLGFPSIVGSGPNSVALHYDTNRRRMQAGDVVVMDIGAEFGYLSADVTRTAPVSGTFTPRQRAIYDLVLATQQTAIDSVRPGMTIPRLNQIARAYLQAHSDTLCGNVTCDKYFVHGLSHWLGMDVHDVGSIQTPLAPGMVLTVEPGIYLPHEALGIRIEDDVLVTAEGHEVLSAAAPRRPEEVEAVMRRSPRP